MYIAVFKLDLISHPTSESIPNEIYNGKKGLCLIRASLIPHLRSFFV